MARNDRETGARKFPVESGKNSTVARRPRGEADGIGPGPFGADLDPDGRDGEHRRHRRGRPEDGLPASED